MARWSKLISAAARHAGELAEKSAEWLRHVADAKDGVGAAPAPGAPPTPAPWMIEHAMSMAEQRGVYDQLDPWSREVYEETIKSGKAWSRLTSADPAKVDLYRADGEDVNMLADPGAATGPTARPAKYDESGRPIRGEKDPKAVFTDPYAMAQQMGYRERPRWLPDSAIDTLLMRCPPLGAVIQTQVANVAKYAVPSQFNFEQGFRIRMKDRLSHPTPADRKEIERITQIIQHSGSVNNGRPRPNFEGFLRAYTRDSLKYDAGAFEILHNRRGKPVEWLPVDGKMIRFAETGATFPVADRDAIYTVGVIESMIVAKWKRKNLSFEPRNVTADIRMMGYGVPEFESMINMVTALLAALTYNRNFFLQGVNARGVLALMGDMPEKQLKDFRNEWYSMLAGSENCLHPDTKVWTREFGQVSIGAILEAQGEEPFTVWTGDGWSKARAYYTQEPKRLVRTSLSTGAVLQTSPDHKVRSVDSAGDLCWTRQSALQEGDWVLVNGASVDGAPLRLNGKEATVEVAELLGWLTGDGYWTHGEKREGGCKLAMWQYEPSELWVRERHKAALDYLGVSYRESDRTLSEERMAVLRARCGLNLRTDTEHRLYAGAAFTTALAKAGFLPSDQNKLPAPALYTAPAEIRAAFLRGLFSANGFTAKQKTPGLAIANGPRRQAVRELLATLGIRANFSEGQTREAFGAQRLRGQLRIGDKDLFFRTVGFLHDHKQVRACRAQESGKNDRLPRSVVVRFLEEVRAANRSAGNTLLTFRQRMDLNAVLQGADGCSRPRLLRFMDAAGVQAPSWLLDYNFVQVVAVEDTSILVGMCDLEVFDDRHQFIGDTCAVSNSWRTPVINTQDVKWIPMQTSNRDMEFTAWVDFLIKTCCAFYQMDPIEINFKFGNQGGRSMFEGASRAKVQESRERGLKPLLRFIAANLNRHIVEPINSDFELMFTGTDMQSPKELADLYTQQARSFMTVNEVRAQQDLPAFRPELGDVILDANWMNAYSSVRVDEREAEEREAEAEQMRELELEQEQQADMVRDAVVGEGGPTALEHLLHQLTSGEKIGPDVTGHGRGAVTPLATGRGSIPTGKPPESTTSLARVRAESRGSYVEGDTGATEVGELSRGWRPSARKSGSQPREAPAVGGEAETTIVIDV